MRELIARQLCLLSDRFAAIAHPLTHTQKGELGPNCERKCKDWGGKLLIQLYELDVPFIPFGNLLKVKRALHSDPFEDSEDPSREVDYDECLGYTCGDLIDCLRFEDTGEGGKLVIDEDVSDHGDDGVLWSTYCDVLCRAHPHQFPDGLGSTFLSAVVASWLAYQTAPEGMNCFSMPAERTPRDRERWRMDFDSSECRVRLDDTWHGVTSNAYMLLKACWEKYPKPVMATELDGDIRPVNVSESLPRQLKAIFFSEKGKGCWLEL